jgi:hypothetical protein
MSPVLKACSNAAGISSGWVAGMPCSIYQRFARSSKSGRAAFPVAEDLEKSVTRLRLDRFRWEPTHSSNGLAHLLQVCAAPGASRDMRFEPETRAGWQMILEVVRDELHELLARQIVCVGHGGLIGSYVTP